MLKFDVQRFDDAATNTATYNVADIMTVGQGAKLANRTAYLLSKKLGTIDAGTEGNVVVFDSDGNIADSGYGIATDNEVLDMLNENLPVSNGLTLSGSSFTVAVGESTDVTVTRLGDGAISVSATTALEGLTYSVSDTKITFSNASAIEGTGVYAVNVAGTDIFNPSSANVSVTGSSGS